MGYSVVILGYRRPAGLLAIVQDVMRQKPKPDVIAVWQNHPSAVALPDGVLDVSCNGNLGCIPRYALALLLPSRTFVFVDDDVRLHNDDVAMGLIAGLDYAPVVGPRSRRVRNGEQPYSSEPDAVGPGATGVVKGLLHAATRSAVACVMDLYGKFPEAVCQDDILMSAASCMDGRPPWQIDLAGFEETYVPHGLCQTPGHYETRDEVCRRLFSLGWNPEEHYA